MKSLLITLSLVLGAVWVPLFSQAAHAQQPTSPAGHYSAIHIKNFHHPEDNVISGGQPTRKQLAALQRAGIRDVISLRRKSELDWDEAKVVESLGMHYHSIPVAGAAGITQKNADALESLLKSLHGQPVLVHCASGNRVGALRALYVAEKGESTDKAIAEGKRWGLTHLEGVVRKKLNTNTQLCCSERVDHTRNKP